MGGGYYPLPYAHNTSVVAFFLCVCVCGVGYFNLVKIVIYAFWISAAQMFLILQFSDMFLTCCSTTCLPCCCNHRISRVGLIDQIWYDISSHFLSSYLHFFLVVSPSLWYLYICIYIIFLSSHVTISCKFCCCVPWCVFTFAVSSGGSFFFLFLWNPISWWSIISSPSLSIMWMNDP